MGEMRQLLERDGAVRLEGLINQSLGEWKAATKPFLELGKPGHRISGSTIVAALANDICETSAFQNAASGSWSPVRAIAFNKSKNANWSLGWHQDRTIAVKRRQRVEGFDVWSIKDGLTHVEPPFSLLERMVTMRLHLDEVGADNAPLLVAKGSHRLGKLEEAEIDGVIERSMVYPCHAEAGDGWLYATPILHASARSEGKRPRRVIQIDFSQDALPGDLEWAGIGYSGAQP
ncbi:MAG: phytanoyl-CoA dioxygenase family protein [Pseudomonadota bacterium]